MALSSELHNHDIEERNPAREVNISKFNFSLKGLSCQGISKFTEIKGNKKEMLLNI
jgi:hypothetical protein